MAISFRKSVKSAHICKFKRSTTLFTCILTCCSKRCYSKTTITCPTVPVDCVSLTGQQTLPVIEPPNLSVLIEPSAISSSLMVTSPLDNKFAISCVSHLLSKNIEIP